jgi:NAD(P)-dependent dehydrogenase (short-subunit alcohol dehydrogenase family)
MEQIPLGRIGRSEDVANAVAFLAGPEAASEQIKTVKDATNYIKTHAK